MPCIENFKDPIEIPGVRQDALGHLYTIVIVDAKGEQVMKDYKPQERLVYIKGNLSQRVGPYFRIENAVEKHVPIQERDESKRDELIRLIKIMDARGLVNAAKALRLKLGGLDWTQALVWNMPQ